MATAQINFVILLGLHKENSISNMICYLGPHVDNDKRMWVQLGSKCTSCYQGKCLEAEQFNSLCGMTQSDKVFSKLNTTLNYEFDLFIEKQHSGTMESVIEQCSNKDIKPNPGRNNKNETSETTTADYDDEDTESK